jgi:hypothetical protein
LNTIHAQLHRSPYNQAEHLVIFVVGRPLDQLVAGFFPAEARIAGLVPTLLNWLADERERQVVWERVLPPEGLLVACPVLMCPDDADSSCTLIVAEVETTRDQVPWHRLGLD